MVTKDKYYLFLRYGIIDDYYNRLLSSIVYIFDMVTKDKYYLYCLYSPMDKILSTSSISSIFDIAQ